MSSTKAFCVLMYGDDFKSLLNLHFGKCVISLSVKIFLRFATVHSVGSTDVGLCERGLTLV